MKYPHRLDVQSILGSIGAVTLIAVSLVVGSVRAGGEDSSKAGMVGHEHNGRIAKHHHQKAQAAYHKKFEAYRIPTVQLKDQNGKDVFLTDLLDVDEPVFLNFVFTSCTTLCPVMTATFAKVQRLLSEQGQRVRFVSVSIDPEFDTPLRMRQYAEKYKARPGWHFLTGRRDRIISVQRAFAAYRGNKMNHVALSYVRLSPDSPWLRIEGSSSASALIDEYRHLQRG